METLKIILYSAGYLIILISLIPLIRQDYWFFRVFEYPRLQKLMVNIGLIIVFLALYEIQGTPEIFFTIALSLNFLYLCYQVFPYTILGKRQIFRMEHADPANQISLYIGNVFQYNKNADSYLRHIQKNEPDVVMLVETDKWWASKMEPLHEAYPYRIPVPLDNTYGMMLYSKLELLNSEVKYLVEKDIPSVHTQIRLPSGRLVRFYGLHPEPPVPQENPRSTERDKEILMVAREAKSCPDPVIVAGDLNDVAWSYTTELFSKTSGLLDPRRGRGFFNTFHAGHLFMRFPLDHIFCSNSFSLVDIKRRPNCGSDHFAMYIKLQYSKLAEATQEEPEADSSDLKTAQEKINKI